MMTNETNEFRDWLKSAMREFGIDNQTSLAAAAALGQTVVSSYLSGARKPERREQVERLVRALLPLGTDEYVAKELLHAGLRAAALVPNTQSSAGGEVKSSFTAQPMKEDPEVITYLRSLPSAQQTRALRILKAAFDEPTK